MDGSNIDVSILIVNYNTGNITKEAVAKALAQQGVSLEVIVIDNASADNSLAVLKGFGDAISLVANDKNLGYGKANNCGAQLAKGRYLCILNSDAYFNNVNDIARLVAYMDNHPQVGLCGGNIVYDNGHQESSSKYDYPGGKQYKKQFNSLPGEIAWVFGALLFIRCDVFQKIHGFDEDYFLYCEDTDLGLRVRQRGYALGHCNVVTVRHLGSATTKRRDSYALKTRKLRSTYTFYQKHYNRKQMRLLVRIKFFKSSIRLLSLRLSLLFKTCPVKADKYQRHRATVDESRKFLTQI